MTIAGERLPDPPTFAHDLRRARLTTPVWPDCIGAALTWISLAAVTGRERPG